MGPAGQLVLEVTESALVDPATPAVTALHQVRADGVRTAIDDLGTGYSSLGQLRSLPVDELEIDRSLIEEVATRPAGAHGDRGHGPESGARVRRRRDRGGEQLEVLRQLGCGIAQGLLFDGPLPPAEAARLVAPPGPSPPRPRSPPTG